MQAITKSPDRNDQRYRFIGYSLFVIFFGGFGGWSALAPLSSAAIAPGVVVVENQRKTIQHFEGGILSQLLVREGDRIEEGQLLAVLDTTQVQANLDVLSSQLLGIRARIARLQAERSDAENVIWPAQEDFYSVVRYRELITEQQALFLKRRSSLLGEADILERRIDQLRSRILGLIDSRDTQSELLSSFNAELLNLNQLLQEGYVDETRIRDLERRVVELKGRLQQFDSEIKSSEIQIGETELQILQRRAVYDTDVQNQLAELQSQLVQVEEEYRVAKDRLIRSEIRAPSEGIVLTIEVTTEGGVLQRSKPFMTIVPANDELVIQAKVNPVDVDRVSPGQVAEIQFSSFDVQSLPKIYGEVISISADAFEDVKSGQSHYLAVLNIEPTELDKLSGSTLVPGMPVSVLIQTGERTLWQYITKPLVKGMSRALIED